MQYIYNLILEDKKLRGAFVKAPYLVDFILADNEVV